MRRYVSFILGFSFALVLCFGMVHTSYSQSDVEDRLKELGYELPEPSAPRNSFSKWKRVGNTLYLSGHGTPVKGTLGKDLTIEEGYEAAVLCGLNILATIKDAIGNLDNVSQLLSARGMVNCTSDFYDQPSVIDGFSDLMVQLFGTRGKHTRAAVGHNSLPFNMAVEIEVVVLVRE